MTDPDAAPASPSPPPNLPPLLSAAERIALDRAAAAAQRRVTGRRDAARDRAFVLGAALLATLWVAWFTFVEEPGLADLRPLAVLGVVGVLTVILVVATTGGFPELGPRRRLRALRATPWRLAVGTVEANAAGLGVTGPFVTQRHTWHEVGAAVALPGGLLVLLRHGPPLVLPAAALAGATPTALADEIARHVAASVPPPPETSPPERVAAEPERLLALADALGPARPPSWLRPVLRGWFRRDLRRRLAADPGWLAPATVAIGPGGLDWAKGEARLTAGWGAISGVVATERDALLVGLEGTPLARLPAESFPSPAAFAAAVAAAQDACAAAAPARAAWIDALRARADLPAR